VTLAAFWLLSAVTAVGADHAAYPDVEVIATHGNGVDLRFAPGGWRVDTIEQRRVQATFAGAQHPSAARTPQYPRRSILVAVPATGEVSVTAAAGSWRGVSSLPIVSAKDSETLSARAAGDVAPPLMQWDGPLHVRDVRAVRIWLSPTQSAATGTAVTDRIDVQVRWTGSAARQSAPRDPLFEPIYQGVFANAEQAAAFRIRATRAAVDNPFGPASNWYKVTVTADGPHRITRADLAAVAFPVNSADPRDFRLFSAGGAPLPVPNTTPRPEFREVPIQITGATDGRFDAGDVIYFFGQATNRWEVVDTTATYVINPYTRENTYWLVPEGTWASPPLRIGTVSATPGADPVVTVGIGHATAEQNRLVDHDAEEFYTWYWQYTRSMSVFLNLPGAQNGNGSVTVLARPLFGSTNAQVIVNDAIATFVSSSGWGAKFASGEWRPNTTVQLDYLLSSNAWIDRVEASYPRLLQADPGGLEFWLGAGSGNHVRVSSVPAGGVLWDVTRADSPFVVAGTAGAGVIDFDPGTINGERHYRLWTPALATAPANIATATPGTLRAIPIQADMVIVTHPGLVPAVNDYAAYREAASGITVSVATINQVYNDFGFGLQDPIAIRDFLKYTYETSVEPPSAVLLIGDGSYDFLNHSGLSPVNLIPPFIVSPSIDRTGGDQNYVSFGVLGTLDSDTSRIDPGDRGWDMMVARWPVRNAGEVRTVAAKISDYESNPEYGLWRNRVVMVADDEFGEGGSVNEYIHTVQAESLADSEMTANYSVRKIYLFEYPRDALGEKPGAREDIVKTWNDGMLLIDYVGHGSPNVWAHEHVLRRSQDVPRLFNGRRLPLVYTASCSIGLFDDPEQEGMGEELLRRSEGGAIAVISATRLVFSQANVDLNKAVLDYMLGTTNLSIGQALFAGLVARQYESPPIPHPIENDRKHILFGDPLLHLSRPRFIADIATPGASDSLVALTPTQVTGQVEDSSGTPFEPGGRILLSVFDAPSKRPYRTSPSTTKLYEQTGRTIFKGAFASTGSDFDLRFMVPKDVSYGEPNARVVVYAEGDTSDAIGIRSTLRVARVGESTNDVTGPTWELTINDEPPVGRRDVGPTDIWKVRLEDPLGINMAGGGHGITATVDGDEFTRRDLTERFAYDFGSLSTGTLSFTLPDLVPGDHEVQLMAWDNANNPSALAVPVTAVGETDYAVKNLLIYPNPFDPSGSAAHLTYDLTFAPKRVELSIFTVSGKRIRALPDPGAAPGFNYSATWDGRDDVGDPVATGIYIVAVEAEASGRTVREFAKIVLVRSD